VHSDASQSAAGPAVVKPSKFKAAQQIRKQAVPLTVVKALTRGLGPEFAQLRGSFHQLDLPRFAYPDDYADQPKPFRVAFVVPYAYRKLNALFARSHPIAQKALVAAKAIYVVNVANALLWVLLEPPEAGSAAKKESPPHDINKKCHWHTIGINELPTLGERGPQAEAEDGDFHVVQTRHKLAGAAIDSSTVFFKGTMGPKDGTIFEYVVEASRIGELFGAVPHTTHSLAHVLGKTTKGYERIVFQRSATLANIHDLLLNAKCEGHITSWGHLLAPEGVDVSTFVAAGGDDRNAAYKRRQREQLLKRQQRDKERDEQRKKRDEEREQRKKTAKEASKKSFDAQRQALMDNLAKRKATSDPIVINRIDGKAVRMTDVTNFLSLWRKQFFDAPAVLVNMDAATAKFDVPKDIAAKFFDATLFADYIVFAADVGDAQEQQYVEASEGGGEQPQQGQDADIASGAPEDV
jgi:hypothetical protein